MAEMIVGILKGIGLVMLPAFLLGNCTGGCIATKVHSTWCDEFSPDGTPLHHVEGHEEDARAKYERRLRRWERNR